MVKFGPETLGTNPDSQSLECFFFKCPTFICTLEVVVFLHIWHEYVYLQNP